MPHARTGAAWKLLRLAWVDSSAGGLRGEHPPDQDQFAMCILECIPSTIRPPQGPCRARRHVVTAPLAGTSKQFRRLACPCLRPGRDRPLFATNDLDCLKHQVQAALGLARRTIRAAEGGIGRAFIIAPPDTAACRRHPRQARLPFARARALLPASSLLSADCCCRETNRCA